MGKFRKKLVVIEAVQLTRENWSEVCVFADIGKLEDGKPSGCCIGLDGQPLPRGKISEEFGILIPTLEGLMVARQGDWIIRGVRGEITACKPDVFEETYEPVDQPSILQGAYEKALAASIEAALAAEEAWLAARSAEAEEARAEGTSEELRKPDFNGIAPRVLLEVVEERLRTVLVDPCGAGNRAWQHVREALMWLEVYVHGVKDAKKRDGVSDG